MSLSNEVPLGTGWRRGCGVRFLRKLVAGLSLISSRYARFAQSHTGFVETISQQQHPSGLLLPVNRDDEVNFTCLTEISLSAAEQHPASCVVGDPTDKQLDYLAEAARRHGVRPAEFFSFPEVGGISLQPPRP